MTDKELSVKWHGGFNTEFSEIWNLMKNSLKSSTDKRLVEEEKKRVEIVDGIIDKLNKDENVDKDVLKAYKMWTDYYMDMLRMMEEDIEEEKKKESRDKLYQAVKVMEMIQKISTEKSLYMEKVYYNNTSIYLCDEIIHKVKKKAKKAGGEIKKCINNIENSKKEFADDKESEQYNDMVKNVEMMEKKLSNGEIPEKEEIDNSYKCCKNYMNEHQCDKSEHGKKRLKEVKKMLGIIKCIPEMRIQYDKCMEERRKSIEIMLNLMKKQPYIQIKCGGKLPKWRENATIDNIEKLTHFANSLRKEDIKLAGKIVEIYSELKPDVKKIDTGNKPELGEKIAYLDKLEKMYVPEGKKENKKIRNESMKHEHKNNSVVMKRM